MATASNGHVAVRDALVALRPPGIMFSSLTEQLGNVRRWNAERRWEFGAADFQSVDLTPRAARDPLVVDVVAVYLPDTAECNGVLRTCQELWAVAAEQQPNTWSWDWYRDSWQDIPKPVRLIDGLVHRPGIRRVTLDLRAGYVPRRHVRPIALRGPDSAHAEVLAAAAHFPRWVRAMDGNTVPYTWLAGYEVMMGGQRTPLRLPALSWSHLRQTMSLTAAWINHSFSGWSAPVCIGRL
ncbi:MAG: hypothetical protein JO296_01440 [Pseudonocardiales bacterium]|nr:hypothetical protein [Pseudonocardiales bacterium]MBV9648786.1 hypothetical protein [Pseudonocardiales bacterium]